MSYQPSHSLNYEYCTKELLGLKSEVNALSKRCQLAEDRETAANDRARAGEERAAMLTMELAKSRAEVSH